MSLGNVSVGMPRIKHSNFSFDHPTDVTNSFGRLKCIHFKKVEAGTKSTLSTSSVTRLAPLANPSFGRLMMKTYWQFVPTSSIYKKVAYLKAQLPRLNNDTHEAMTPVSEPYISASVLYWYILKFSWLQLYQGSVVHDEKAGDRTRWTLWGSFDSPTTTEATYLTFPVPSARPNFSVQTELAPRMQKSNYAHTFAPSSADGQTTQATTGNYRKIMYKLTKKSLALRDSFIACGCVPCGDWTIKYNFLHLIALYKAYYDIMLAPITQYESFEYTWCAKIIKFLETTNGSQDFDWNMDEHKKRMLDGFMDELAQLYYTANVDFLSSHLPFDFLAQNSDLNIDNIDSGWSTYNGKTSTQTGLDRISLGSDIDRTLNTATSLTNTSFSQYKDDWLKRCFYLINSRSQVGYELEKELRLRGFGDWVEDTKSRYIGHSQYLLPISEVISTADTSGLGYEASQTKRQTGDYSGQSSTRDKGSVFHHVANQEGFVICFNCIVPDLHTVNGATDDALSYDVNSLWSELTDSLGYVATPRICIGFQDYSEHLTNDPQHRSQFSSGFGIIPRHFGKKLCPALRLGQCNSIGEVNTWNSFFIDRFMIDHVSDASPEAGDTVSGFSNHEMDSNYNTLIPQAGENWRQFASIPVADQFDKIFYYEGLAPHRRVAVDSDELPLENFVSHFSITHSASSPMLATSMSFPTYDKESEDTTVTVEK